MKLQDTIECGSFFLLGDLYETKTNILIWYQFYIRLQLQHPLPLTNPPPHSLLRDMFLFLFPFVFLKHPPPPQKKKIPPLRHHLFQILCNYYHYQSNNFTYVIRLEQVFRFPGTQNMIACSRVLDLPELWTTYGSQLLSGRSISFCQFATEYHKTTTTSILFTHKSIIFKSAVIDFKWVLTT